MMRINNRIFSFFDLKSKSERTKWSNKEINTTNKTSEFKTSDTIRKRETIEEIEHKVGILYGKNKYDSDDNGHQDLERKIKDLSKQLEQSN
jgi:hypothetical protein